MAKQVLQLNFDLNISRSEYEAWCQGGAQDFAAVPGLLWKIWFIHDERNEAGGVYLFESQQALEEFLASPLAEAVSTNPAISNFSAKTFDILTDVTAVTRGPVRESVAA